MVTEYPVKSVAFSPDGTEVLVGTTGGAQIARVSIPGGNLSTLRFGLGKTVYALAYSPDCRFVLAVYDAETGNLAFDYKKLTSTVLALAWPRDGGKAAAALSDGALILLNPSDLSTLKTFSGYGEKTRSQSFNPDGSGLRTESIDDKTMEINLP